jgi:CRISPR-associated protein Csd1
MILQALKEYYDRKAADTDSDIAPPGWEWKEISYIILLDKDGKPTNIESTVEGSGKNKKVKRFLLPQSVKRTVGVASNLLWDGPEYALGIPIKGKPERVVQQHEAFKQRVAELGDVQDDGVIALKKFLALPDKEQVLEPLDEWANLKKEGAFFVFKLNGASGILTDSPAVKQAIDSKPASIAADINAPPKADKKAGKKAAKDTADSQITCLISGEKDELENLHTSIKGVWGAQSTGANIVSFNLDAFKSFGKSQGQNAPVGKKSAAAYTTALNTMLAKGSKNRMQVGDASTVFWASKQTDFEDDFYSVFNEPPKDDPDAGINAVRSLYESIKNGAYLESENKTRFYVLGLAPNAARISIRFWTVATVPEMAERIRQHFEDTKIVHSPNDPEALSIFRLLVSTAVQGKSENIPPNLGGETMRAILEGQPYPDTLFQGVIRRIRAEHEITYPRAAIIKAYLNRNQKENITEMLNLENRTRGYRLGRLFAVLEKIQKEAINPSATIRDRFYGAASGTPAIVFSNLMRLKNHHLSKLTNVGRRVKFEKLLCEIIGGIQDEFPPFLEMKEQGQFAVGYYHQTQDFYKEKDKTDKSADDSETEVTK